MNLLAEVGDTACSWCCSLSWNWVSGVLGAGFKAWPSAKPGVGNTRFSQVSPVHFPVLVFLSKGPVLLNTNFNLNMNFKGFFCKTFSQLHLGTASGESAQHEPSSPRGVQAVHCDLVPRGGLPGDLRPPPLQKQSLPHAGVAVWPWEPVLARLSADIPQQAEMRWRWGGTWFGKLASVGSQRLRALLLPGNCHLSPLSFSLSLPGASVFPPEQFSKGQKTLPLPPYLLQSGLVTSS